MAEKITKTGVKVSDNFRDNLIIDRYDPIFATMRGSKINYLRSEHSEDALTWNVFRSFRQINPVLWLNRLFNSSFGKDILNFPQIIRINLWPMISPPPARRLGKNDNGEFILKDEGDSEIDIMIETELFVWVMEAKYKSDPSDRTTNDPARNQIIRNIDVGSWYAGVRDFYFSLIFLDEEHSKKGIALIKQYNLDRKMMLELLPYRHDGLHNLKELGSLTWLDAREIINHCCKAGNEHESYLARRVLDWFQKRKLT